MYCAKCGVNLNDDVVFCPKCGTKSGSGQETIQPAQVAAQPMSNIITPEKKVLVSLRVLSIIGIILFSVGIIAFFGYETEDDLIFGMLSIFGFGLAHAIVTIVQGGKYKVKVMTVMAILAIILYALSFIIILENIHWDWCNHA